MASAAPIVNMGPPMVEVKNIFFKAHPVISFFADDSEADAIDNEYAFQDFNKSLECSNKHGCVLLTFSNKFYLLRVSDILSVHNSAEIPTFNDLKKLEIRNDALLATPNIISLSNGEEFLAVDTVRGDCSWVVVFKFSDFINQGGSCRPFCEIRCPSSADCRIGSILWNPGEGVSNMVAISSDDGSLFLAKICGPSKVELNTLTGGGVRCCCWSPKGKQLVIGRKNGSLSQLRLDLTEAKQIPGPEPGSIPVSILWTQTTQFLVVFHKDTFIDFMQLDVPKGSPPIYTNNGDIFISEVVPSKCSCYFIPLMQWNVVLAMTNSASDVVVLVKEQQNSNEMWIPADITDNRRAAFLLDNYARGAGVYFGCGGPVTFSDVESYSPMPMAILLSQRGSLLVYSIVNSDQQAISLNSNVAAPIPETIFSCMKPSSYAQSSSIPPTSQIPATFFQGPKQPSATIPSIPVQSQFLPTLPPNVPLIKPVQVQAAQQPVVQVADQAALKPAFGLPQTVEVRQLGTSTLPTAQDMAGLQKAVEEKRREMTTLLQKGASLKGLEEDEQCVFVISEIRKFEKRLADFRTNVDSDRRNLVGLVNTSFDALEKRVLATLNVVEDFSSDMVSTTSAQKEEVEVLKERILNHFSQLEYAKSLVERSRDPRYLEHLRSRPLDPMSQQKFEEIKKLHNYLKVQIAECRRYFYEQNRKRDMPIDRVSYTQLIYLTLSNHSKIIRRLKTELDNIKERLGLGRHNVAYEEAEYLAVCEATNSKKMSTAASYEDPDEITLNDLTAGISRVKLNRASDRPDKKPIKLANRKLLILKKCMPEVVVVKVKADEAPWTRSPSKTATRPKPIAYSTTATAVPSTASNSLKTELDNRIKSVAPTPPTLVPGTPQVPQQSSSPFSTSFVTLPTSSLTADFGSLFKSDLTGNPADFSKSIGKPSEIPFGSNMKPSVPLLKTPIQMPGNTNTGIASPSNQSPMLASLLATSVPASTETSLTSGITFGNPVTGGVVKQGVPSFGTGAFTFGSQQGTPPANKGAGSLSDAALQSATASTATSHSTFSSTNSGNPASAITGLTALNFSSLPSATSSNIFGTGSMVGSTGKTTGTASILSFGGSSATTLPKPTSSGLLATPVASSAFPGFGASLNLSDTAGKKSVLPTAVVNVSAGLFSSTPIPNTASDSSNLESGSNTKSSKLPSNTTTDPTTGISANVTPTNPVIPSVVKSVVPSSVASSPPVGFKVGPNTTSTRSSSPVSSGQPSTTSASLTTTTSPTSLFGGGNIVFGTPTKSGSGLFTTPPATGSSTAHVIPKNLFTAPQATASSVPLSSTTVISSSTAATEPINLISSSTATVPPANLFSTIPASSTSDTSSAAATSGVFSSNPASSTDAPSAGLFSSVSTTTASGGMFATTPAPAQSTGTFSSVPASTTPAGLFSSTPTAAVPGGLFSSTPAATAPSGLFSSTPASTVPAGLFSSAPASTSPGGLFSSAAATAPTTTTAGLFGSAGVFSPTTTSTQSTTGFLTSLSISDNSNKPAATTTSDSTGGLFSNSTFGAPAPSAANIFGGGGNAFGNQSATSGQTGGVNSTTQTGFGVFGQPKPGASLFGTPATTTPQAFGGTAAFGGGAGSSPFGSSFGGASAFGSGNANVFGSSATSTISQPTGFGTLAQQSTTTSAFGGSPFAGGTGQQQASVFGSPAQQKSPGAGGLFSSSFGSPTAAPTAGSGVFGGGGSVFGGSTPGGTGGTFSTGTTASGVAQQGFGFAQNKPTTGAGFGGSPVFGGGASFGSSSPFGSTFAPSPGSTFGTTGASVFGGGGGAQNTGFGTLAQQSSTSPGFGTTGSTFGGNTQPQPQPQPSLFGSPQQQQQQGKPGFGGQAFSSWR